MLTSRAYHQGVGRMMAQSHQQRPETHPTASVRDEPGVRATRRLTRREAQKTQTRRIITTMTKSRPPPMYIQVLLTRDVHVFRRLAVDVFRAAPLMAPPPFGVTDFASRNPLVRRFDRLPK